MDNKSYNVLSIVAVLIAVLGLTVAFSALNTSLSISGVSTLKQASWEIGFNTPTNLLNSAGARYVSGQVPTVVGTTVTFSGELDEPGDYLEFTLPIENSGSIDAILSTVTQSVTGVDNSLLQLTVLDNLSAPVTNGSMTLDGGQTKNISVRLAYRTDIEAHELPVADRTLNVSVTLLWEQN